MHKKFSAHLDLTKAYWKEHVRPDELIIDATCGNGYDTLFLAQLPLSKVVGIDIQPEAIKNTKNILEKHGVVDRVILNCGSHESFEWLKLPDRPKLIVYNLGYLPGGNKTLTTQTETTLASLRSAMSVLGDNGAISVTCYPGHSEGEQEEKAILSWAESLCPKKWLVCYHRWMNRHKAPTVLWICRVKSSESKDISPIEITITQFGLWLCLENEEFFLSYQDHPFFKAATLNDIYNVELPHKGHLYWPKLDVDLHISILKNPHHFPLIARHKVK